MLDKLTTAPKTKPGAQVGRLDDEVMVRLDRAMTVFLGMAGRGGSRNDAGRTSAQTSC